MTRECACRMESGHGALRWHGIGNVQVDTVPDPRSASSRSR
ncbi:hypothetical protein EI171_30175 [Bradyrhizobium sp. LCT2]|nr:hypothetical protein EI171_30175 [Bradyrhizobium sp. LCT2]